MRGLVAQPTYKMTTQLELQNAARELANQLHGETSARKINVAINEKFSGLGLDDEDYNAFTNAVLAIKGQNESFANQPLITEQKRKQAEAAKPKTT